MTDWLFGHGTHSFVPRGSCYAWNEGLISLQMLSDATIGFALLAIAATLAYPLSTCATGQFKRPVPVFCAFIVFIVACSLTYFLDLLLIWRASYWLDVCVRMLAALASACVVLLVPTLVPRLTELARGLTAARERGVELAAAVESLEGMYETTKELERLKTQFFASISHELRGPLMLVLGPLEKLLHGQNLTLDQRSDAELVFRNCRALLGHVNNLLDVSRLEAGKLEARYARCDLSGLLRRTASHFDTLTSDRNLRFVLEAPDALWAEVDPELLQRVLLNLLANAFRFTPNAGLIRVSLKEIASQRALLEVADSGPFVRPEHRNAIFDRYQQPDTSSTRRFGGAGLGLALAKDFVTLHAGSMSVADADGGAVFRIELPLQAPANRQVRAPASEPLAQTALEPTRLVLDALWSREHKLEPHLPPLGEKQRPLVLVVEDNPEMNRFVCETLSVEYRTQSAADGCTGLEKALRSVPDLVLTDLAMPGMSGEQLVQAIRNSPELDETPVLLLSGRGDDTVCARLLREGAQDFVLKPFVADELRARVANLLCITRTRRVLQKELNSQMHEPELLALALAHQKRELHAALEGMRAARTQAEETSREKSGFLALVAQELRTPLSALSLELDAFGGSSPRMPQRDANVLVGRMQAAIGRLCALTDGVLHYARIESGHLCLHTEVFDVGCLAEEVLAELRLAADDKGLQLALEVDPDAPRFEADREVVRLILRHLVENALQFTEQGLVRVAVAFDERSCRLTVVDSGPGIPREQQSQLFRAYEADEQGDHISGVGLSIALVRPMVDALGGSITFSSRVGHGTKFSVRLPHRNSSAFESGLQATVHA